MLGDDPKQNDYTVANAPEHGGNLAVEAHNISVVSQFEIPLMTRSGTTNQYRIGAV
jgi:hypothetical protein